MIQHFEKSFTMDAVKLAQFDYASDIQTKLKILKDIDISHCVPSGPPTGLQKLYEGYNCLHFAVKRSNLNLINVLLDQGVDLMKQGITDGRTPLHKAFHHQISCIDYPVYVGEFGKNELIDTLLSAQVTRNQLFNPQSKEGMTHLHIACIVNHIQAVSFFAQTKEYRDQAIYSDEYLLPGYTALHFAVKHSSIEPVKILLRNGADMNLKDSKGISSLDLLIQRLLDLKDLMSMGKRAPCCPYQNEIDKLESIAKIFLENIQPNHADSVSDAGVSIFHLACVLADPLICTKLLREISNVNMSVENDSQLWLRWTPLHFAACCSFNVFKVLLQHGADITAKNARGEAPLDFFTMRHDPEILCSILSMRSDIKNILMSDGTTKMLDLVLAMNDCDTLSNFLENLRDVNISVPVDSPIWPGYSSLHLAAVLNEKTKQRFLYKLHSQEEPSSQKVYTCTEEEEKKYWKRINVCLAKSCSPYIKNVDGLSPIHLAFHLRKAQLVDLLLDNCQENAVDPNIVSLLHIACATGRLDVVEDLLDRGADVNIRTRCRFEWYSEDISTEKDDKALFVPVRANSTPLHVAVIFGSRDVTRYLLSKNADAYAKDELGLTPIHLSMVALHCDLFSMMAKIFLFEHVSGFHESVSNDGLSHLHVAAYADDEDSIEQLILQGANVDAVLDATVPGFDIDEHPPCELSFLADYVGMTPLRIAIRRNCSNAVRVLIRHGADIFAQSPTGETPLNCMQESYRDDLKKQIVQKLKRDQRVVGAIDPSGMTLLHVACASLDYDWAKKLLERGADANARMKEDKKYDWAGKSPLDVLVSEATMPDEWPTNLESFVKLLIKYGADVAIEGMESSTLHYAYGMSFPTSNWVLEGREISKQQAATMLSIADLLLKSQSSFDVNPMDNRGYSHFHFACSRNEVAIVGKFLNSGIDVNLRTDPFFSENAGWTPLHFAFKHKAEDVARLLIERGADVKAEDRYGVTPLHVALQSGIADLRFYKIMLSKGADINAHSILNDERPIDLLLKSSNFTYKQMKFFLANGCTINVAGTGYYDTTVGSIMKNAEPRDRQVIFEELMKICDLRHAVENGFNAIGNIVSVRQEGQLTLDYYLENIRMFMEWGYQLDQQNQEGETALHLAADRCNLEAIEALLLLGANMNVVDRKNEPPFTVDDFGYCDRDEERDVRSLKILAAHTWKMKFVGLKIHELSEEGMNATFDEFPLELDVQRRCESELEKLERKIIGGSSTMRDFLRGSVIVNRYATMPFVQRQIIDDFFRDNFRAQFPELAGLLTMQYRMALQRVQLYELAKRAMATILYVELPDLCSENILSNFENEELKEIIEVAQEVSLKSF